MTILQLFRLWARRAPIAQRVSALVGAGLVVAVVAWLLVPAGDNGTARVDATGQQGASTLGGTQAGQSTGAGADAGAAGPGGDVTTGGSGTPSASGAGAKGGSGTAGAPAGAGCTAPPGTDQGVTANSIKVAVLVLDLAGAVGNSTYHVPPPEEQQAQFQKVVDAVNASGGVACRKIVAQYFRANAIDSAQLQQLCKDIVQTHPFFMFGANLYLVVYPTLLSCYVQNGIPFIATGGQFTAQQATSWYPYAFSQYLSNQNYKNLVFALAQRGWFSPSNGFKKLGVVYQDCDPQIPKEFFQWLRQASVPSSQVTSYNLSCSGLFTSPTVLAQAIVQFKSEGVTNVTFAYDERDYANWTNIAEQQKFRPKYAFADETQIAVTYSNNGPNFDNIDGALAITDEGVGEEHTPGMAPSAATRKCLDIFGTKLSYPVPDYDTMLTASSQGGYCGQVWQFQAMVNHAPALQRAALAAGLQATKSLDLPYPFAPVDWSTPSALWGHTTWGGQYWRVNQFFEDCKCFRLVDRDYHRPF
jgi:hypothetical protein